MLAGVLYGGFRFNRIATPPRPFCFIRIIFKSRAAGYNAEKTSRQSGRGKQSADVRGT
jgi:hypothetical protein